MYSLIERPKLSTNLIWVGQMSWQIQLGEAYVVTCDYFLEDILESNLRLINKLNIVS
jgi:hypothetical protein